MTRLAEIVNRYGKRQLLIGVVAVLLAVNFVKIGYGLYDKQKEDLAENISLLEKYQRSTGKIEALRNRVEGLEKQSKELDSFLFTGESDEEIASAIQIMLQDQVVKSGLEPESLRPTTQGDGGRGKDFGEVSIKVRLAGTLDEFILFLADLYKSEHLFKIESFTLKPYKKSELKIFLDMKGFYKIVKGKEKVDKKK
jgi:Tfp pilus assembly protein PilO